MAEPMPNIHIIPHMFIVFESVMKIWGERGVWVIHTSCPTVDSVFAVDIVKPNNMMQPIGKLILKLKEKGDIYNVKSTNLSE